MGTPLMNQLLDEAVQCCAELAARAAAGVSAAHEVLEQAQALGTRAVEATERLHHEYTEAIAAVRRTGQQSGHAADITAQELNSVTPEAIKAATAVKDMLVAMEGEASNLAEARSRGFHDLQGSALEAENGFHSLAAQVHAFEEHMNARLDEAKQELSHFQGMVDDATKAIEKAHQSLYETLDDLGHSAHKVTSITAHGLEQMLAAVANGFVDYSNNAIESHNDLVDAVRHSYLDESKSEPDPASTYLTGAFDEARDAMGRLQAMQEPAAHSELQSATDAILQEGEKAVAELGEVAQTLSHSADVATV
ncbi:MAG TPA: hypothetical protein VN461_14370 [Vicinamibacteria bacterium]|jgi:hypothetical protein|nr:hypothetical protein [Vicinamibacteria bacterium]